MPGLKPDPKIILRPHGLISHAWRWGAGVISAGAGLVSILVVHALDEGEVRSGFGFGRRHWPRCAG